jgi:hypothetical protein
VARMLEANARKRKAEFPSKEAARERFCSRPPFKAFDPEALQLYIEHGFETLSGANARCRGWLRVDCRPCVICSRLS